MEKVFQSASEDRIEGWCDVADGVVNAVQAVTTAINLDIISSLSLSPFRSLFINGPNGM